MVTSYSQLTYICTCDKCGLVKYIPADSKIRNGAYAVRSIFWSFGRDGKTVICDKCRRYIVTDKYRSY